MSAKHGTDPRDATPAYAWLMVAVAPVFLGMGSGALVSIAVFLKPLAAEFGWERGEAASAYLAATIASGLAGIGLGYLADRFSTRPVVTAGALGLGLAWLLMQHQSALWQFIALSALAGGLGNGAFFAPLTACISGWFHRGAGLALGIATAGHALGQGVVLVAGRMLIAEYGWREAYGVLGWVALGVLLPLALLVRDRPRAAPVPPAGPGAAAPAGETLRAAMARLHPAVLLAWVAAALLTCCLTMSSPTVHLVALATDKGIDPTAAAALMMTMMGAGVVGRIGFGRLADAVGGLPAYGVASVAQTALVFWFTQLEGLAALHVLAAAFGVASSGLMTAMLQAVRQLAPPRRQAFSTGVTILFGSAGMGIGAAVGGALFDATGSYLLPFALSTVTGGVNAVLVLAMLAYGYGLRLRLPRGPAAALAGWRAGAPRPAARPATATA